MQQNDQNIQKKNIFETVDDVIVIFYPNESFQLALNSGSVFFSL